MRKQTPCGPACYRWKPLNNNFMKEFIFDARVMKKIHFKCTSYLPFSFFGSILKQPSLVRSFIFSCHVAIISSETCSWCLPCFWCLPFFHIPRQMLYCCSGHMNILFTEVFFEFFDHSSIGYWANSLCHPRRMGLTNAGLPYLYHMYMN